MKKISLIILLTGLIMLTLFLSATCFADIRQAHEESLELYRAGNIKQAIEILEKNNIQDIIDTKPDNLSAGTYVTILNNYGFFLSKTEDRYQEAIPVLERVIELSPKRVVAYFNIGDVYLKLYQEKNDNKFKEKVKEYYNQYISLLKVDASVPLRVKKFLRDEAFERAIKEIRKTEYEITYYSSSKNFKNDFFENFIDDFKNNKNIKFIEPILETDDIDNKELNEYFNDSPELKERVINMELSPPIKGGAPLKYKSQCDYKLYHINFDNNQENGKEYLFYSGGYMDIYGAGTQASFDYYQLLNFKKNKYIDGDLVHKAFDYENKKKTNYFNGILKYKGIYFVYEIDNLNQGVTLNAWDQKDQELAGIIRYY